MKVTIRDYFGEFTYTNIQRIVEHGLEYILVMNGCNAEAGIHVGINDIIKVEK